MAESPDPIAYLAKLSAAGSLVDTALAKALGVSEVAQMARSEVMLRRFVEADWNMRAKRAARAAEGVTLRGSGKFDEEAKKQVTSVIDAEMGKWSADVGPRFIADVAHLYALGRKAGARRGTGATKQSLAYNTPDMTGPGQVSTEKVSKAAAEERFAELVAGFDVVDTAALKAMEKQQLFWIGRHYDSNVSSTIKEVVNDIAIQAGESRVVAGKIMQAEVARSLSYVKVPGGFNGTSEAYFQGLVANAATVARVDGQLQSFARLGIKRYEIINPIDERTCPVCGHMNGKVFEVKSGVDIMSGALSATTPEGVSAAHPWLGPKKMLALSPTSGRAGGPDESKALASARFALPPFHYRCFPGDVAIQGAIIGASKALYEGKVVKLTTAKGRRLTVTPNHPVLTSQGFVDAGALRQGNQLVGYRDETGVSLLNGASQWHEHEQPTIAEDVFRALAERSASSFVPASPDDFHGEARGFHGDVEVVGSYRELFLHAQAIRAKKISEFLLEETNASDARLRSEATLGKGADAALGSAPSALALAGNGASAFRLDRLPLQALRIGSAAEIDACAGESAEESGARDAHLVGELLRRFPGEVAFDEVVEVWQDEFSGHVYDLQSETGWVVAQGIFASNCRCTVDVDEETFTIPRGPRVRPPPPPPVAAPPPIAAPVAAPVKPTPKVFGEDEASALARKMRAIQVDFDEAAMSTQGAIDEKTVRESIRSILSEFGMVSRDTQFGERSFGRHEYRVVLKDPKRVVPEKAAAVHTWNGRVGIKKTSHDNAATYLDEWGHRGGKPSSFAPYFDDKADGLRTVLHEELHGCSPETSAAYREIGIPVEEVTTEIAARAITFKKFGSDVRFLGSYQEYIGGMNRAVAEAFSMDVRKDRSEIFDIVANASFALKGESIAGARAVATSPDQLLDMFVERVNPPSKAVAGLKPAAAKKKTDELRASLKKSIVKEHANGWKYVPKPIT